MSLKKSLRQGNKVCSVNSFFFSFEIMVFNMISIVIKKKLNVTHTNCATKADVSDITLHLIFIYAFICSYRDNL